MPRSTSPERASLDMGPGTAMRAGMGNGHLTPPTGMNGGRSVSANRASGVYSEMKPEKGDWDNLFFEVKKASLRSETWDQGKGKGHKRSASNVTI